MRRSFYPGKILGPAICQHPSSSYRKANNRMNKVTRGNLQIEGMNAGTSAERLSGIDETNVVMRVLVVRM
jgi:hypothetical protein